MGNKVLVTRAREQSAEFSSLLKEYGLEPVLFPTIEFAPPSHIDRVWESIANISSFDWVLLTSVNGVKCFFQFLEKAGNPLELLHNVKICTVGPRTAESVEDFGLRVDLVPEGYQAEGVLHSFKKIGIDGLKILFPRAEEGREILPEGLESMGAVVCLLPVYRTIKPEGKEADLVTILREGIDVITFTSGSTVRNFMAILGESNRELLNGVKVACISEVTAKTAEKEGLKIDILPEENTTASLACAIKKIIQ